MPYDGADLVRQISECFDAAYGQVADMAELGKAKAEAERAYRTAKSKRLLYEREYGKTPVSIIADVVKGYEDIALLACGRDCAEAAYDANREALLLNKKRIDFLREQMSREWGAAR